MTKNKEITVKQQGDNLYIVHRLVNINTHNLGDSINKQKLKEIIDSSLEINVIIE